MFSKLADGGHAISKIDFNFLLKKQFKVESFHKSDSRNTNVHLSDLFVYHSEKQTPPPHRTSHIDHSALMLIDFHAH